MSIVVFSNNASSLMASSILAADTQVTVQPGEGVLFPAVGAGQIMVLSFEDVSGNIEIVHGTGITGDVITISRAQEGTTAMNFASGSRVEIRVTAGVLAALLQKNGGDVLTGTTTFSGVLAMGSSGSIQGGEYAGGRMRGSAGETDNEIFVPTGGAAPTIGGSPILTAANLATHLPSGFDLVQSKMIVWWYGTTLSIPAGWQLCNGTSGTPDLRDKFIMGGGGALASSGGSATTVTGATSAGAITVDPHVLSVAELPSHTHTGLTGTGSQDDNAQLPMSWIEGSNLQSAGTVTFPDFVTGATGSGTGHSHTASASATHTHSYQLPPYIAILAIMKL